MSERVMSDEEILSCEIPESIYSPVLFHIRNLIKEALAKSESMYIGLPALRVSFYSLYRLSTGNGKLWISDDVLKIVHDSYKAGRESIYKSIMERVDKKVYHASGVAKKALKELQEWIKYDVGPGF